MNATIEARAEMERADVECDPAEWPAWTDDAVWNPSEMVRPLTPRQAEVYALILELTRERGMPPTTRELSSAMGCASPNAVQCHLAYLRDKGWLKESNNLSRGIVPRYGRVSAPERRA
jgi:hypothetical protein